MSALSNVSRAFYTLIERKEDFNNGELEVEELTNERLLKASIKMEKTLDRVDTPDKESLAEKLEQLKTWLIENKDQDGLIDCALLASKIRELNLEVQPTIQLLKEEYWLRDAPYIGKFGVR